MSGNRLATKLTFKARKVRYERTKSQKTENLGETEKYQYKNISMCFRAWKDKINLKN